MPRPNAISVISIMYMEVHQLYAMIVMQTILTNLRIPIIMRSTFRRIARPVIPLFLTGNRLHSPSTTIIISWKELMFRLQMIVLPVTRAIITIQPTSVLAVMQRITTRPQTRIISPPSSRLPVKPVIRKLHGVLLYLIIITFTR